MTALDQGEAAHAIAISNFIQTVRSTKTARGFGSNYGAGGSKSVDRTEPALASRVLLALHSKYKGSVALDVTWVVKLVLQDLLDWQEWTVKARVLQPLGLLAHGSNAVSGFGDYAPGQIAAARMESGMDNSPMCAITHTPHSSPCAVLDLHILTHQRGWPTGTTATHQPELATSFSTDRPV